MAGTADGLYFDYDAQNNGGQQHYSQPHPNPQSQHQRLSWPVPTSTQHQQTQSMTVSSSPQMNMNPAYKRSSSPLPLPMGGQHAFPDTSTTANQLMGNWQMNNNQMPAVSLGIDTNAAFQSASTFDNYGGMPFQTSPQEFIPHQQTGFLGQNTVDPNALNQSGLDLNNINTSMPMDNFINIPSELAMPNLQQMPMIWPNVDTSFLSNYTDPTAHIQQEIGQQPQQPLSVGSPSDWSDYVEVQSLPSSDNGSIEKWQLVGHHHPQHHHHPQTIFNPDETLHTRTGSDSSQSEYEQQLRNSLDGVDGFFDVDIHNLNSPSSESGRDSVYSDQGLYPNTQKASPPPAITTAVAKPIPIRRSGSHRKSPVSPRSRVSKTPIAKSGGNAKSGPAARRATTGTGREEKRVGRRKGPLNPDQRKQAGEIRKLGACIRCRFLKKTCDKGDPCAGCQPSHARLWLVPCTRVDIKDLGYFLKGWRADYERHVTLNVSVTNVKGFSDVERTLLVTHGYGHYFPIQAREVYVRDESIFGVDWVEAHTGQHEEFKVDTARLSAGSEGVSTSMLSEYLDMHIDGGFQDFVDEHFQGTPFITEMLKIAYRFWTKEKIPVIRKALKLVLAYNLTQAILLVKGFPTEEQIEGKIDDSRSEFNGETAAPMMINFQVKTAMADLWRELQKSLLEDLSQLYSSIYSRDKLKHWPTIFMIASVLLVVWEEMQFDCRYRIPDEKVVEKFCHDMESTPVGVIVGLFSAISQKVPAFTEWDTEKHHSLLGSNAAVCKAMEDVREGLKKHDKYLRNRNQAKFDRNDFDSLSNMFVSKLVIRAH